MWNGYKIIDADAHMHEPQYLWERYVEAKYRDQVPKVAFMDGNIMVYEPDGKFVSKGEIQAAPPESARRAICRKIRRGLPAMVVGGDSPQATWTASAGTFKCCCRPVTMVTSPIVSH